MICNNAYLDKKMAEFYEGIQPPKLIYMFRVEISNLDSVSECRCSYQFRIVELGADSHGRH